MSLRAGQLGQTGDPGPVGSVGKLFGAEHTLRVHELLVALLGAEGMLYPELGADGAPGARTDQVRFLRSRANTIEGGTSEVMRNILGEPRPRTSPRRPRAQGPAVAGHPPQHVDAAARRYFCIPPDTERSSPVTNDDASLAR